MNNINRYRATLLCIFIISFCKSWSQTNEDKRAQKWMEQHRLKFVANADVRPFVQVSPALQEAQNATALHDAICAQMSAVGTCQSFVTPLPVTGLELTGKRISAEKVQLNWETIAEYNNKGFVLERQSGANTNHFDSVTFTEGKGTSYSKSKYNYTDINGYPDKSYYRIKQMDIDGKFTYSNVITIEGSTAGLAVQVMPNPGSSATVGFYISGGSSSSLTSFTITNAAGMVLAKKEKIALAATNYISLRNYHLPKGFYYVSVYNDKETITKKFIVE